MEMSRNRVHIKPMKSDDAELCTSLKKNQHLQDIYHTVTLIVLLLKIKL